MNTYVYASEYIIGSFKYLFIGYIGKVWADITHGNVQLLKRIAVTKWYINNVIV